MNILRAHFLLLRAGKRSKYLGIRLPASLYKKLLSEAVRDGATLSTHCARILIAHLQGQCLSDKHFYEKENS
jgi:hypothetical protein